MKSRSKHSIYSCNENAQTKADIALDGLLLKNSIYSCNEMPFATTEQKRNGGFNRRWDFLSPLRGIRNANGVPYHSPGLTARSDGYPGYPTHLPEEPQRGSLIGLACNLLTPNVSRTQPFLSCLLAFLFWITAGNVFGEIVFEKTSLVVPCEVGQATVTAEFPFHMEGTKKVSVTSIKSDCKCTVGTADAKSYAAGAKGKIKVVFTPGDRVGVQRKTLFVKTSDGKENALFLQTTVPVILEIAPMMVLWKKGEPNVAQEARVKVQVERPVKILRAKVTPEGAFAVNIEAVPAKANDKEKDAGKNKGAGAGKDKEPGVREYVVKIQPKTMEKVVTGRIVLETDFPADKEERFVIVAGVR